MLQGAVRPSGPPAHAEIFGVLPLLKTCGHEPDCNTIVFNSGLLALGVGDLWHLR